MIKNTILKRISTRTFNAAIVSCDYVYEGIEIAKFAPSGKNRQPWKIKILTDKEKKELLGILISKKNALKEYGSLAISINSIYQCSKVLLVFNPFSYTEKSYSRNRLLMDIQSIGAFIQNLLLFFAERNIASLWINDVYFAKHEIEQTINSDLELVAAIAIGYSSYTKKNSSRKSLNDILI